jgi:hypothetical protein
MKPGTWIQTYTKRAINPLDPDPRSIHIDDIAHALACNNRFTGHTALPYNVAEHSWHVSVVASQFALRAGHTNLEQLAAVQLGLLHDASEAYLSDIASPVKRQPEFKVYREIEARLMAAIEKKFGLENATKETRAIVAAADLAVLRAEARSKDLFPYGMRRDWKIAGEIADVKILGISWYTAERVFHARFEDIFDGRFWGKK